MNDFRVPGGLESDPPGFPEFGLKTALLESLRRLGHAVPTPIQQKAIPLALAGNDVIGCAQTGTGKTAAFCLPLIQRFDDGRGRRSNKVRALVLTPTRELAAQIGESMAAYGQGCAVSHTVIFGGVGQSAQARDLRRGVDVLIATPGRLEDLISQRIADLSQVEVLILDEVDRMLDQGFLPAVRRISRLIPAQRQTLMFSATLPKELRQLARDLLRNPKEIAADTVASTPVNIDQKFFLVDPALKRQALERLLNRTAFSRALVFTRTKHGADRVARHLKGASLDAEAIHGGKSQSNRERTLAAFRDGSLPILVATDLAARGIHVDDISHVINFDLPMDADNYVHRIGRTARAGASGEAISLCSHEEHDCLKRIERLIQKRFELTRDPTLTDGASTRAPSPRVERAQGAPDQGMRNHAPRTERPTSMRGDRDSSRPARFAPARSAPGNSPGAGFAPRAAKSPNHIAPPKHAPFPKKNGNGKAITGRKAPAGPAPAAHASASESRPWSWHGAAQQPKTQDWRPAGQRFVRRDWQS
ncbi:MAG TPA: DEAD/DEAH box helicase [Polyangiaceae bacterium]|nr:DEAD/DEAH box helicase [Polyangiaceae bacterium]